MTDWGTRKLERVKRAAEIGPSRRLTGIFRLEEKGQVTPGEARQLELLRKAYIRTGNY